eukprot:gene13750-18026_t
MEAVLAHLGGEAGWGRRAELRDGGEAVCRLSAGSARVLRRWCPKACGCRAGMRYCPAACPCAEREEGGGAKARCAAARVTPPPAPGGAPAQACREICGVGAPVDRAATYFHTKWRKQLNCGAAVDHCSATDCVQFRCCGDCADMHRFFRGTPCCAAASNDTADGVRASLAGVV